MHLTQLHLIISSAAKLLEIGASFARMEGNGLGAVGRTEMQARQR
jgi:hypothetical protein